MDLRKFDFNWIAREAVRGIRVAAGRAGVSASHLKHNFGSVEMFVWPQEWPDANCGKTGYSPFQELTVADTAVFKDLVSGIICVTHNHEIAYTVVKPNAVFYRDFQAKKLIGTEKYSGQYEETVQ